MCHATVLLLLPRTPARQCHSHFHVHLRPVPREPLQGSTILLLLLLLPLPLLLLPCTAALCVLPESLQGSTFERTAGTANPNDPKSVFKDLDLDVSFKLPKELHDRCAPVLEHARPAQTHPLGDVLSELILAAKIA